MIDPAIVARASDALRSALIFTNDDERVVAFDGGVALLAPSNPGYWWGNGLRLDRPPAAGDLARRTAWFDRHVRSEVPQVRHATFGWDGDDGGDVEPFIAAGFTHFTTRMLGVDRGGAIVAPHVADGAVVAVRDDDWDRLVPLFDGLREPAQTEAEHAAFIAGRVAQWRRLVGRGRGAWFAIEADGRPVATLGVFAEAVRGTDGRRIGRFQQVVTDVAFRRRGHAGTLVAAAARHAFEALDVDTLLIGADAHGDALRLYAACGFRVRSTHHGVERG